MLFTVGAGFVSAQPVSIPAPNLHLAIADYTKVVARRPDFAEAYLWREYTYTLIGNYAKVIADTERAMKLKPKFTVTRGH